MIAKVYGKNIRQLRERTSFSQEDLAEQLGCSDVTIGRVERGVQRMKLWRLIRLCDIFQVSLDSLVRDTDPSALSPVPSYLVRLFKEADEIELEILKDHIKLASREIDRKRAIESRCQSQSEVSGHSDVADHSGAADHPDVADRSGAADHPDVADYSGAADHSSDA